ncbi:helix-turn-helix domain-containing protein [Corynebacterium uropygiale]|uniref:Helix-turn-helix domain-containing protein n=1 Tax=Corynebacterium uropygiale TaxID=1775911 RepID=A0A9X1QTH9_9CORY|nr:helix-turn-helix domain-containing protein [Corynebacterium uropygiale]MCF4007483.1 helix-turn-helix domain-containing protein [Corynebacterium uropygiale]
MANSSSGESVLERAAKVLSAFTADHPDMSAAEVARATGLSSSTAHRLCRQMVDAGLLDRLGTGRFVIGGRAWDAFLQTSPVERLRLHAHPVLERLHAQLRCYVALAIPDFPHRQILNVDYRDEYGQASILAAHGERADIFTTSAGIAFLAFGPRQWLDELVAEGPVLKPVFFGDPVDTSLVEEQVRICRERGHSHIIGGVVAENTAIAAPVRGARGDVVAAMSATLLTKDADHDEVAGAVIGAAKELSERISNDRKFTF